MSLKLGFASRDITPALGGELSGYGYYLNRVSTAVQDPLFARAVALQADGDPFVLVNLDVLGVTQWMVDAVRGALKAFCGLPVENVLLLSIHTHTGPALGGLVGCGELDAETAAALPGKIIGAAMDALKDLTPVTGMRSLEKEVKEPIGYNRTGADALDTALRALTFAREGKRPLALLSYSCHPVTYGRSSRVSADYPGAVVRALDALGYDGLFVNAVCGDVDPVSNREAWGSGTPETTARYAKQLLDGFESALVEEPVPETLCAALVDMDLPLHEMTPEELALVVQPQDSGKGDILGADYAAGLWVKTLEAKRGLAFEHAQVQLLALGRILMAAVPYEMFTPPAQTIRAAFPGKLVFIPGNANATTAYLPDRPALEEGISYAAVGSCIAYGRKPFEPAAPDILVEKTVQGLKALIGE